MAQCLISYAQGQLHIIIIIIIIIWLQAGFYPVTVVI
jgi:hypothetical protein